VTREGRQPVVYRCRFNNATYAEPCDGCVCTPEPREKQSPAESIPSALLDEIEKALKASYHAALTVKFNLDTPYTDAPEWTPWTRFVNPAAKRAHGARQALRAAREAASVSRTEKPDPDWPKPDIEMPSAEGTL
jgi:hypothetical protein